MSTATGGPIAECQDVAMTLRILAHLVDESTVTPSQTGSSSTLMTQLPDWSVQLLRKLRGARTVQSAIECPVDVDTATQGRVIRLERLVRQLLVTGEIQPAIGARMLSIATGMEDDVDES